MLAGQTDNPYVYVADRRSTKHWLHTNEKNLPNTIIR